MSVSVYKKVAIEVVAKRKDSFPVVLVLTSSNVRTDSRPFAIELVKAFVSLKEDAVLADAPTSCGSAAEAETFCNALMDKHQLTVLPLPCLREQDSSMLLTAVAKHVVLVEQQNLSRTDEITQVLEILRNLEANPLGFLLV